MLHPATGVRTPVAWNPSELRAHLGDSSPTHNGFTGDSTPRSDFPSPDYSAHIRTSLVHQYGAGGEIRTHIPIGNGFTVRCGSPASTTPANCAIINAESPPPGGPAPQYGGAGRSRTCDVIPTSIRANKFRTIIGAERIDPDSNRFNCLTDSLLAMSDVLPTSIRPKYLVSLGRFELPPLSETTPSTLRVYQFRHRDIVILVPGEGFEPTLSAF